MSRGIPLTDADRLPWLETLRQQIKAWIAAQKNVVLACSALKRTYRQMLGADSAVKFVYLKGRAALIAERLRHRHGHFTGESILASQMTDLQEPETAVVVDIRRTPSEIVDSIRKQLALE
jgi:gluconokinase